MPRSTTKNTGDRFHPSVIACGILIVAAIIARVLLPMDGAPAAETPQERTPTTTTTAFWQQLRAFEGRVARFADGQVRPEEIYDVAVASLPEEIQQQLATGSTVTSEEELYRLLENFTS